jgi:UDP-N-acetylglucosamine 2-epimerase
VACASALLERYGRVVDVIQAQGFSIAAECWSVYEGENLLTSAKETGALLGDLAGVLRALDAGIVVACADRHEVLAVAQAAAYLHLPLAHLQGGERTGSIDDRVRDSVSALATYHFTCTELAKYRVYGLTGAADRIWNVGCGSIDLAKRALSEPPVTGDEIGGTGPWLDTSQPFLLVLQHPDTRSADAAGAQMRTTLEALPAHVPALCPVAGARCRRQCA